MRSYLTLAMTIGLVVGAGAVQAAITATPNVVTVVAGQTSGPITLNLTFAVTPPTGARTIQVTGMPTGTTSVPSPLTYVAAVPTNVSVRFQTASTTPPGTYTITFTDLPPIPTAGTTTVTLIVQPVTTFTATVAPNPVPLVAGGAATSVAVTTLPDPGFSLSPIAYSFSGFPSSINTGGVRSVQAPTYQPVTFTFSAAANTQSGTYTGQLLAALPNATPRIFPVSIIVTPLIPPPVITGVVPSAVVVGTISQVFTVMGRNFVLGSVFASSSGNLVIENSRVLSPSRVQITASVRTDATPGPVAIGIRNPNGALIQPPGIIVIHPTSSLGAPAAVLNAVITSPMNGALISYDNSVFASGLLATSGIGSVVGSWRLDGVPFDRFHVAVSGGDPVQLRSSIPIPTPRLAGSRLELVIEAPMSKTIASIKLINAQQQAARPRLLEPFDGATITFPAPVFRWSLVPGAFGYVVEINGAGLKRPIQFHTSLSQWQPTVEDLKKIGPGSRLWRMVPVLAGGALGQPTPARRITVRKTPAATKPPGGDALLEPLPIMPRYEPRWRGNERGVEGGDQIGAKKSAGVFDSVGYGLVVRALSPQETQNQVEENQSPVTPTASTTHWQVSADATATYNKGENHPNDSLRFTPSAQWDLESETVFAKGNGNVGLSRDLGVDESDTEQESRNWLVEGGARGGGVEGRVAAGTGAPRFTEQTQILTAGLARAGAQATVSTKIGAMSYYSTFEALDSAAAGSMGPRQDVRGWALEAPQFKSGIVLRAVGLRTTEQASEYSPGGESTVTGIFGLLPISPAFNVTLEGARGQLQPLSTGVGEERQGNAFLVGVNGDIDTFGYTFNARKTDKEFSNLANPGLTSAGTVDRSAAELQLRKMLGTTSLSLQLRHLRGGEASGGSGSSARENAASFSLSSTLATGVTANLTADLGSVVGDADEVLFLPETDVKSWGFNATVSEMAGTLSLSQTLTLQNRSDRVNSDLDSKSKGLSLAASGSMTESGQLSANASWNRMESGVAGDRTDQLQVSLSPSWTISSIGLSIQPRLAYNRSDSGLLSSINTTDQYQMLVSWAPSWLSRLFALQLSGDWSRNRLSGTPSTGFSRTLMLSFTLHWGAEGPAPAPVMTPVAPGTPGSTTMASLWRPTNWRN